MNDDEVVVPLSSPENRPVQSRKPSEDPALEKPSFQKISQSLPLEEVEDSDIHTDVLDGMDCTWETIYPSYLMGGIR